MAENDMQTPESIENAVQRCILALQHSSNAENCLAVYSALFASLPESEVPGSLRPHYEDLKYAYLVAVNSLPVGTPLPNAPLILNNFMAEEMLIRLLAFYRDICGWLAVEEYIAWRNKLTYQHTLCY
ncbi:hypothetical protein [Atlantibacter hermannii]|uniref:hypothetical protein n=1 Tax=Atlantibacter hermannii TaxID=565 RepID=UPI001931FF37|nr:hypothetical protein [Atlantibacter hermannii]MBL7636503.1 hypothetical protein [Atlantibacter hermannii]MBL7675755.1 hypothetical protein [Atlantibacter hermannii]